MSFHVSNFGHFGRDLPADVYGYVPEADDGPWDFSVDHGSETTHDEQTGQLTDYGQWWVEDGFPHWRAEAVKATRQAQKAVERWNRVNAV